jgi:hypothetical protein
MWRYKCKEFSDGFARKVFVNPAENKTKDLSGQNGCLKSSFFPLLSHLQGLTLDG